jgi:hypothetical protein
MPEPKIERYEVITVETISENKYGDTVINGRITISKNRQKIIDVFQPGAEVKVGFVKSAKGTEYPGTAEQTGAEKEGHLVKAAKAAGAVPVDEIRKDGYKPPPEIVQPKTIPPGQEVGMTTKEIGDMIRANKLSIIFGEDLAKKLVEWYKKRIETTTGIN